MKIIGLILASSLPLGMILFGINKIIEGYKHKKKYGDDLLSYLIGGFYIIIPLSVIGLILLLI